jgi:hypothetical protein
LFGKCINILLLHDSHSLSDGLHHLGLASHRSREDASAMVQKARRGWPFYVWNHVRILSSCYCLHLLTGKESVLRQSLY